jgi:hypothetical protein
MSDAKEIHINFEDLDIVSAEIEELLGFEPGHSPEPFPELIEQALQIAPKHLQISGAYQIFNSIDIHLQKQTIQIEEQLFHPGEIVVSQLKKATQAALFVCTAGSGITELSKQKISEGDELMAYVLDVIGSVTVEKAAGEIQKTILEEAQLAELSTTDPFSPGYCNWSVAEQHKLFSLLPAQICGISLSDYALMYPVKSVSGITGIGKHCERKGYQCTWCTDRDCFVGEIRRRKNVKKNV